MNAPLRPVAGAGTDPAAAIAAWKSRRAPLAAGRDEALVPLLPADVTQGYVDGLRDPEVTRFMYGVRKTPQTWETVTAYVAANHDDPASLLLGVHAAGALRGTIRLHAIDAGELWCHLGICIFDRSCWGSGLAGRGLAAAIRFAVADVGLRRILAGVDAANEVSRRLFARAGFRADPAQRYLLDGRPTDLWVLENGEAP